MVAADILFRNTIGSVLIGSLFATTLFGFATLQSYYYYTTYPNDHPLYKAMVGSLWLMNTIHTVFICHVDYFYLIEGFLNRSLLVQVVWTIPATVSLHLVQVTLVSLFFTWQIFQVSSQKVRWWLSGTILALLMCNIGLGVATVIHLSRSTSLTDLHGFTKLMSVWSIMHLIPDALISVSLMVLFRTQRGAFSRSNRLLNTLIIYALNRYLLSTSVTLAEIIALLRSRDNLWYVAVEFILPGVYTNSLLATLNARSSLRGDLGQGVVNSVRLPDSVGGSAESQVTQESEAAYKESF